MSGLQYFTHVVDEQLYGAWYREIAPREVEVIGVGLLEVARYAGFSPETTAKSVLENHVRQQIQRGTPMPSLKRGVSADSAIGLDAPDGSASLNHMAVEPVTQVTGTPQPISDSPAT